MFYNRPKPDVLDLRHLTATPQILRKIVRKMQYRSQAVLSMTCHFGWDAARAYGPELLYVRGFLNGAKTTMISHPPTMFIWDIEEQPMCWEKVQKDDVIVVYNNLDVTEMRSYINMEGLYMADGYEPPHIIVRRPRENEILTLSIEFPLYDQSEPGLGFDIPEDMPAKRRLIVDRVHWKTEAEQAGLCYGDEILKINGKEPEFPYYADIIAHLTREPFLKLTIRRIGFEM